MTKCYRESGILVSGEVPINNLHSEEEEGRHGSVPTIEGGYVIWRFGIWRYRRVATGSIRNVSVLAPLPVKKE